MLTPEQADLILKKDLANIIAKTRDGKPLTAPERRVLRSVPATGEPLPDVGLTINALSDATGADRRTLKKILKDAPPVGVTERGNLYTLAQAKAALEENARGSGTPALAARKMLAQILILEHQHKKDRGEYFLKSDIVRELAHNFSKLSMRIDRLADELAPSLAGLTVAQIHDALAAAGRDLKRDLRGAWEDLKNEPEQDL